MLCRQLQTIAFPLVAAVACSSPERRAASDTVDAAAERGIVRDVDSAVSTLEMRQALTRDVEHADRQLMALEDSVYLFMGDTVTVLMKRAHASWEAYRKLECDAVAVAFARGTMAPVAQMECWIDLTDDHRRFLAEQYDYMRTGARAAKR